MGIDTGGNSLGPPFPRRRVKRGAYKGFRNPPPFNPLTGKYEPLADEASVGRIAFFTLVEEFDDYLVCEGFDPLAGEQITAAVAKPFLLQRSPFDGKSVDFNGLVVNYVYSEAGVRQASGQVSGTYVAETQAITPDYFVGDTVSVARVQIGQGNDSTGYTDADGLPIEWADLNVGARTWAVVE